MHSGIAGSNPAKNMDFFLFLLYCLAVIYMWPISHLGGSGLYMKVIHYFRLIPGIKKNRACIITEVMKNGTYFWNITILNDELSLPCAETQMNWPYQ